jgi:uncharacterized membrane protein
LKKITTIIKPILIGGLFFLVPVGLLVVILGKVFTLTARLFDPLLKPFHNIDVAGVAVKQIVGFFILLLICLAAGLLARTAIAKRFLRWLEDSVLRHVPGYLFLKHMGENVAGLEKQDMKIVLARVDDGWQISFLIEQIDDNMYTVFVPNAPSVMSGSVYHVEKDRIMWVDMTRKQAVNCIRQLGIGSASILKNQILPQKTT